MSEEFHKLALDYHKGERPGKIFVSSHKSLETHHDLSLAYTPGVAAPVREIAKDESKVYDYTIKGNLVAVITDGSAVLGLGNVGPLAAKPVMEGKGLLFKIYADLDVFDIEVDTKDIDKFVETVKMISPTFGGINLEDIKAPECFEIERRLKAELDIPVMHDDQHGTAVISSAGIINACKITDKFASSNKDTFSIKTGIIDGEIASIETINTFAKLPSREELLGQLAATWMAPVTNFVVGLDALRKKKENEAA